MESFQRHDLGLRGDQVNDARNHGAVSEGLVVVSIEDGGRGLIQNRSRRLADLGNLHVVAVEDGSRRLADIRHFRTATLVASEVVAGNNRTLQGRMIGINARIDHCDGDARARRAENGMHGIGLDQLVRRLIYIATPNCRAVVGDRRSVVQIRRNRSDGGALGGDQLVRLDRDQPQGLQN